MDQEVRKFYLPKWANRFPTQRWIDAMPRAADGIQDKELRPVLDDLYELFPHPGQASHIERLVTVMRGRELRAHKHPQHTLVFYIDVGDPPVPIIVSGEEIKISPGMAVLMPPHTLHAVPKSHSDRPRVSIALRWTKEWKEK